MKSRQQQVVWKTTRPGPSPGAGRPLADRILTVVDAGLLATICAAPFVFGGRHDVGRLVFVALVGVTAAAWFLRQSLLPKATWTRTAAYGILLLAAGLVALQLVPLPAGWLARLSPRTLELLPLWTNGDAAAQLGVWKTLSLTPHETTLSLALLASYGLLFTVLTQRLETISDVEKLLNAVGIAAVLMAGFGLVQFFFSNGQFYWCYLHPYRTTDQYAMGSFMNRNHFAGFLVLGVGPLVRWFVSILREQNAMVGRRRHPAGTAALVKPGIVLAAIAVVLMGIALSLSRGGALALATATVVLGAIYWRWRLVDGKYLYGLAGIGLVMLGLLSLYGYDEVAGRLDDFAGGSIDSLDRGEGRRKVWAANLEAIEHGWLTGSGAGSHGEICPVYLSEPTTKEYSHAENGYLQIATENGVLGVALLAAGIGLCGVWCLQCLGRLDDPSQQLCFGAAAAGLAASLVHSLVDFVWYIPACMSLTLALAVCALRLAQLSRPSAEQSRKTYAFSRPRWLECTAVATMLGAWTIYAYFGPAVAAIHFDRYCRDALAKADLFANQLSPLARKLTESDAAMHDPLSESMQHHLEQTIRWDPAFAEAYLRLAALDIQRFELAQQDAENAMPLQQIRDAAQASTFASTAELRSWLDRAVGSNVGLLDRAHAHARQTVALCPLQGDAYVFLAQLGFLAGDRSEMAAACIAQAQCVRPYNGDVVFEVGRQALVNGDFDTAMRRWSRCFRDSGDHQLRIVDLLAGKVPASVFVESLQPDWRTLREIWARYRQSGSLQDRNDLVAYAAQVTQRDAHSKNGIPPAYLWLWQAAMYSDLGHHEKSLACLEHAYECDQQIYSVRYELACALKQADRFVEAEPHLRWCLARRPENKGLRAAIFEISKLRVAQREPEKLSTDAATATWRR